MERVATLLRANISELLERADDPERVLKQLVLDMENQLMQVKTQVAIALADQHLLERRARELQEVAGSWHCRAELAVQKKDDALARAALERAVQHETLLRSLEAQIANQAHEAEAVRATYSKLQAKMSETQGRCDLLLAARRRVGLRQKATALHYGAAAQVHRELQAEAVSRLPHRPMDLTGSPGPDRTAPGGAVKLRFAQPEHNDRVEALLADIKGRQSPVDKCS